MAVPEMVPANVFAAVVRRLEKLEAFVGASASTSRMLESATIGQGGLRIVDAGIVELLGGGQVIARDGSISSIDESTRRGATLFGGNLRLFSDFDNYRFARLYIDDEGERLVLGAPLDPRVDLLETFISVAGAQDDATPETIFLRAGNDVGVQGKRIMMNPTDGVLTIYNLPPTGGGYALRYAQVGADWTMAIDSSSQRYKTDDSPADDIADQVLQWVTRRFRYKAEVEQMGDDAPWYLGFFAEQIDEHTPEVVVRDDQGRPDALQHDRMIAPVVALVQRQEREIAALKAALAAEKKARATFEAKVAAALKKLGINL